MKYPNVLFYTPHPEQKEWLLANTNKLDFTIHISDSLPGIELRGLLSGAKYDIFVDCILDHGEKERLHKEIRYWMCDRMCAQWIQIDYSINNDTYTNFNNHINNHFAWFTCGQPLERTRPIFSAFTPCYNTYDKIHRVYAAMMSQTMGDWEWVIMDDSPDDAHFEFLRGVLTDPRVRLYRRSKNSGCIGNVKNEAASLCRGKYLLELDHDDVILPTLFQEARRVFEQDENVGFVYSDFFNIYESGANFRYSDFISFGYGGYYSLKHEGAWRYVYITPNVNNITASALISLPNHPRIWRASVLHRIGNYSEYLPICDDLDVLIRTLADKSVGVAKIHKSLYIQYMNDGGNNFSWIRNAEINRLGPRWLSPRLYNTLNVIESFKERGAYEDISYLQNHSQLWKRPDNYVHRHVNTIVQFDYDKQICIIGSSTFAKNIEKLREMDSRVDIILLDNQGKNEDLWKLADSSGLGDKIKTNCMTDCSVNQLVLFFKRLMLTCADYEILLPEGLSCVEAIPVPGQNTDFGMRHQIIMSMVPEIDKKYWEIGVEYGTTIKNLPYLVRVGIDPSPKVDYVYGSETSWELSKMTSDEYFEDCDKRTKLLPGSNIKTDIVFIDGMHQCDYVWRDLRNSLRYLSPGGCIFIDDVLPLTEEEQLRVPIKHVVEDGVLKYAGGPWTGDVWKIAYYLLSMVGEGATYKVFIHPYYRGVLCIQSPVFQLNEVECPESVMNYTYLEDFPKYVACLTNLI